MWQTLGQEFHSGNPITFSFYFPEFKPEKLRLSKVWKPVTEHTDLNSQLWIQTQPVQIPSSPPSS